MTHLTPRGITRLGSAAILLLLAACGGSEQAKPEPEAPAPTTNNTTAVPGTSETISVAECQTPSQGRAFFGLGEAVLAVPSGNVLDTVPAGVTPPVTKESILAHLKAETAKGAGCPERPLKSNLLLVQEDLDHPLLENRLAMMALPPGGIMARFNAETARLQKSPGETCRPVGENLIGCAGTEKRRGGAIQVMYIITTDTAMKLTSGGPLAARCILKESKLGGCNLVDELPGGIAIDVNLKSGAYSAEGLRKALAAAIAKVDQYRS